MADIPYIKLSDLTRQVEAVIRQTFDGLYWIVAEISGHKFYPNQDRHYFELVEKAPGQADPVAKVKGIAWSSGSQNIKLFEQATGQNFTNGLQVLIRVRVEFHPAYGLSLILNEIDPYFTLGNLEKQRRETLQRLVAENPDFIQQNGEEYLTKNKSLPLNCVIQNIAIIGSPNSEGYTDFTHTITSNQFGYRFNIDIYQSSVQGSEAERELVGKLIAIFESGKKYDCVVIIRGGGAKTDFLVFDSYGLSKAVAKFPVPVITGLGHHKDVSIVDLMAHTSTKTPTKAAEFIISHNRTFEDGLLKLRQAVIIRSQQLIGSTKSGIHAANLIIVNKSRALLHHHKDSLAGYQRTVVSETRSRMYNNRAELISLLNQLSSQPKIILAHQRSGLTHLAENLRAFTGKYVRRQQTSLEHYGSLIRLMSPESILRKGFAIVSHKGEIVKDAGGIQTGDELQIVMSEDTISTRVTSKTKKDERKSDV